LSRAAAGAFDAVVVDQLMPGTSGTDVLEKLHAARLDLAVIVITGFATPELTAELVRRGARACLVKPFTPEQLRNAVCALFDR